MEHPLQAEEFRGKSVQFIDQELKVPPGDGTHAE
jgi:hypothetical protein